MVRALPFVLLVATACTDRAASDAQDDGSDGRGDDDGVARVTLQAGFDVSEIAVTLATAEVQALAPNTAGGRDHGTVDLGVAVAQVLSLGSIRGEPDAALLCERGTFASIEDIDGDQDACEWTPRIYLAANTGDTAFLDELVGTGLLATDGDPSGLYRLWIVGGTFDANVFTLTLDLERLE